MTSTSGGAPPTGFSQKVGTDRTLTLLHLRKTFSAHLKESSSESHSADEFDKLLPLFNRIMSMYTPDELAGQFKELISFTQRVAELLVDGIRRRANLESTREAAAAVAAFLAPATAAATAPAAGGTPSDAPPPRGWTLLKSMAFILNSGMPKILEPICKCQLPSTFVKVFYLFFDLSIVDEDPAEVEARRRLYDLLVTLMNGLCEHATVAAELIQHDDLVWLFVGASTPCGENARRWRDAHFAFLTSIIGRALTAPVLKYIHSKGCIGHYLKNLRRPELSPADRTHLFCNLLDLLRSSAATTTVLIDDFKNANGYEKLIEFCVSGESRRIDDARQIFDALVELITVGDASVSIDSATAGAGGSGNALMARSARAVRVPDAYLVLDKCFCEGSDELCILVLEQIRRLFDAEKLNYFIVDKYYSLYLFVERMTTKCSEVQSKVLEIVELVLRDVGTVPCKELTVLNTHTRQALAAGDCVALHRFLAFFFRILPTNIGIRDAYRDLLLLDTFLSVLHAYCGADDDLTRQLVADVERAAIVQLAMELLVTSTKGNAANAQFVAENVEMRVLRSILLMEPADAVDDGRGSSDCVSGSNASESSRMEQFRDATLIFIRNLLYLAKNEQLFSSLLQLLFSEPDNVALCTVVLTLFSSALLESHKVRVMFRKSGGYICLMTLLLHLENGLRIGTTKCQNEKFADILRHIALIFRVLTVSMRYEPSNAKYFLTEVKPEMINSILKSLGCFTSATQIRNTRDPAWSRVNVEENRTRLALLHRIFRSGEAILDERKGANDVKTKSRVSIEQQQPKSNPKEAQGGPFVARNEDAIDRDDSRHSRQLGELVELDDVPPQILHELVVLRLLFNVALDHYDKPTNLIHWASDAEWLQSIENVEAIPLFSLSSRTVLVHPRAVICLLQMVPSISADPRHVDAPWEKENSPRGRSGLKINLRSVDNASKSVENLRNGTNDKVEGLEDPNEIGKLAKTLTDEEYRLWTASAQFYTALVLKALLRVERNQQIMCQHEMPRVLLDVGTRLFRAEKHPLLPPFYYLFERLACQSMHPRELRRFLRLDQPLCCLNLDESDDEDDEEEDDDDGRLAEGRKTGGGPVPIHRVKALVSMLTPRNHSLVHSPAFVEFDLTMEGFACLFFPSISNIETSGASMGLSTSERLFPPLNGITFMIWFYVDDQGGSAATISSGSASNIAATAQNSNICLLTLIRNFEGTEAQRAKRGEIAGSAPNLENHLTCFYVHLNLADRCLLVSTAEHSVVDELRRDFVRPAETCAKIPLSEQYFHTRQWTHLAVVLSKALLKHSQADVYVNGRCLHSQKLAYIAANVGGPQAQLAENQPVHALVGTPPFLRRPSNLRWKISSLYLIEDPVPIETIRRVVQLQPHYIGNLQVHVEGSSAPLVAEEKLIFAFNAKSTAELTAQTLRPMLARADSEAIAALLGIGVNDNSTPLRILWNTASHANGAARTLVAILVGYLGMRTFAPCPVSAMLDSIGGVGPLLGLIAMCTDSHGLYASLKALVSAVQTNQSIVNSLAASRGYQTLAVLLEEKAHLINAHILHLVLSLAGTVDVSKENTVIANTVIFDDLLCDLDVWRNAPDEVKKLLFEHFYELIIDDHADNLQKVRLSSLFFRLLIFLYENRGIFPIRNDVLFRLVGAIVQFPCEPQLLLRLGQTISATVFCTSRSNGDATLRESTLPFHIAELERLLLDAAGYEQDEEALGRGDRASPSSPPFAYATTSETTREVDARVYAIYFRNRLLNIFATMLAHSTGPVNAKLCETIVNTLGYGWLLSLCAPGINSGTLYLALKILINILKYPALMDKFREGSANGGWLSDADSVIRNRAAVLLGFSVSAHGGAVGSKVDVNPELSNSSGFAALEHLMYSHADRPFVYLAMLAILFNQPNPNVQPLEEFTVDAIWSHVFTMRENGSVSEVLDGAQFCGDVLLALLAMTRACVQRQRAEPQLDDSHWSHAHAGIVLQLITFLYQNAEPFFAICHTEIFVVALFSALVAAPAISVTGSRQQLYAQQAQLLSAAAEREKGHSRSVSQILEFLTNILVNDLCLPHDTRNEWPFDAIVEYLESGTSSCSLPSVLYTELVNACLDRFMSSDMFFANVALMVPRHVASAYGSSSASATLATESTALNVVHFLSKMIDSVWNCLYRGNPIRILKCFLKLLAEAHVANKAAAQLSCTEMHVNTLFRIVLYLISRPIDNIDTQMSVLDTLAEIVRNQHILLAKNANNPLYFGALVHLVFMLSEKPDILPVGDHLERGTAQVSMCAQNVWGLLWQQKKALLDEIFKRDVDLEMYTARAACGETANRFWLQFVDAQTECATQSGLKSGPAGANNSGQQGWNGNGPLNFAGARGITNNVGQLQANLQSRLSRVARSGFQKLAKNRRSLVLSAASFSSGSMSGSVNATNQHPPFQFERLKIEPETFYMWIRVHLSLLRELVRAQCQRYHEWHVHVRKWCLKEWHNIEAELTRERGLWGPERCSRLDKYELDVTEGPHRIRRKLVPSADFYRRYPYRPYLDSPEAKALRGKLALSKDSKLYYERMRLRRFHTMDDRIVDTTNSVAVHDFQGLGGSSAIGETEMSLTTTTELNLSMIKRMVQKNLVAKQAGESRGAADDEELQSPGGGDPEDSRGNVENEAAGIGLNEDADKLGDSVNGATTATGAGVLSPKTTRPHVGSFATSEPQSPAPSVGSASGIGGYSRQPSSGTPAQSSAKTPAANSVVGSGPDNQTLLRLLEQGEQLHSMFRCARIQGLDTLEGLLLFGRDHYYVVDGFTLLKTREIRDLDFLPEQFHDPIVPYMAMGSSNRPSTAGGTNRRCSKFSYDDIKEVHKRRYLLQPIALEVFSADGRNYLLAFPRKIRDRVFQKFVSMAKSASSDVARTMAEQRKLLPAEASSAGHQLINQLMGQQSMTQKWQRGEISNFQYLMYLNTLAGRSYNDLSQYPVFPWILADYDSQLLDLTNPRTFRDLSKPMGAQSVERLAKFLKRYREWDDPTGDTPPYMYGTHYSSAMIVLSYLVRLEPFTEQFLKLQDGHFDLADRMFHSVRDAFVSASRNNMADVRELIPEFFYSPEMFLNANNFDLGVKQNGVPLHHVQLPRWAHGCPYEFVRLHREALECDYVSERLHEWIDLIFGYRQSGEPAKESHNVFHHLFYEANVNFDAIDDPLTRNATLGFINNFGQIPSQLFRKPHPQKRVQGSAGSAGGGGAGTLLGSSAGSSSASDPISISSTIVRFVPGVSAPKLFYHCPENLRVSAKPVKELKAAVGDIVVNEKNQVIVLEQNKIFLPPNSYLAWGFNDRSVRVGTVGTDKSECVCETSDVYEITCMATVDGRTVFVGLTTGTVLVWNCGGGAASSAAAGATNNNGAAFAAQLSTAISTRKAMDAHTDVVTALAACGAHNFVVSASRDRSACVWHSTRFTFIRQLADHPGPVTALAVNDATGDIATASQSFVYVWTVNGTLIATVDTSVDLSAGLYANPSSIVLCLSFSTFSMREWDAQNVILCGTSDGLIKIYSVTLAIKLKKKEKSKSFGETPNHSGPPITGAGSLAPENDERADGNAARTRSRSPRAAAAGHATRDAVREHILRRQQRIQHHHNHRLMMVGTSGHSITTTTTTGTVSATEHPDHRHQIVSPGPTTTGTVGSTAALTVSKTASTEPISSRILAESTTTTTMESGTPQVGECLAGTGLDSTRSESAGNLDPEAENECYLERSLRLRRVLADHTGFNHAHNAHPAPVTWARATRDHRALLVGDGVGRVWLWTMSDSGHGQQR